MASQKAQKLIDENPVSKSLPPPPPTQARLPTSMPSYPSMCYANLCYMVFSKSYCPYCKSTKSMLSSLDANPKIVELDEEDDGSALQDALEKISGQRTVPNVYIAKKHIGGNSDIQSLSSSGKLKALLAEAGAIKA
ncbi:hypothetical protein MY8738_002526 [Beauveria namnaoensis]